MKVGVEIDVSREPLETVPGIAADVERAGLDLVWLTGDERRAVVGAAACAARTRWLHIGVDVGCGSHPVYLAEELHVLDQLTAGRLVVAVTDPDPDRLMETVRVLLAAGGGPFRHDGPLWRIPAGLPEHTVNPEHRVRVTPPPFGWRLELWTRDPACAERFGLPLRPVAVREQGSGLVARLRAERGPVLVRADPTPAVLDTLAHHVRPRLQLDRLPAGLEDFWDSLAEAER